MFRLSRIFLSAAFIALVASSVYAQPLVDAKRVGITHNMGRYVLVLEEGSGDVPKLAGSSTLVFLGSQLLEVSNENLRDSFTNGYLRVVGRMNLAVEVGRLMPAKAGNLIAKAAAKLTLEESNAYLATAMAVAAAELDGAQTNTGPSTKDILASFRALMAELGKPLKFQTSDGEEEYCYYGDYLEAQWGWDSCD